MPLLSCILLSHLFLMSLQLSAIVILFSELVPTLFDTELAVFYSPMLTTASFSYSTLLISDNVISLSLFFISPYMLTPQFLSFPTTLVHLFFWRSFGWILACFFSSFLKIQACFISYLATVHIVTPSEGHWTAIAVFTLEIVS